MRIKKHLVVDLVLIVGTLLVLGSLFLAGEEEVRLSPIGEQGVLFVIEGDAENVLISESLDFINVREIVVRDGELIRLAPGIYYFEIDGESELKQVTVEEEEIVLELRRERDVYLVVNAGGELGVEKYQYGEFEGQFVFGGGNEVN
jgi:hypothetical protein